MFIIDDIAAALWPTISGAASTAMNVIGGVNAVKGAMSGTKTNDSTALSPMTGSNIDEKVGDIGNITNAISGNPIVNLYGQVNKSTEDQNKLDELDNNTITSMINSNNQRVAVEDQYITGGLKQYANGGVPNDGKPAVIYDMKTGQPTGTMNEKGAERIVPASSTNPEPTSIVNTILGGVTTSPQNSITRPNGTFMGMGDFGESMRSMLRLVGSYQDMKRADVGLGKSAITPWLDWMDTEDKNAMIMNAQKEKAIASKKDESNLYRDKAADNIRLLYKDNGILSLDSPELQEQYDKDVEEEFKRLTIPNYKKDNTMIKVRGEYKRSLKDLKGSYVGAEILPIKYKYELNKIVNKAKANGYVFKTKAEQDAYIAKVRPDLVEVK